MINTIDNNTIISLSQHAPLPPPWNDQHFGDSQKYRIATAGGKTIYILHSWQTNKYCVVKPEDTGKPILTNIVERKGKALSFDHCKGKLFIPYNDGTYKGKNRRVVTTFQPVIDSLRDPDVPFRKAFIPLSTQYILVSQDNNVKALELVRSSSEIRSRIIGSTSEVYSPISAGVAVSFFGNRTLFDYTNINPAHGIDGINTGRIHSSGKSIFFRPIAPFPNS